MTRRRQQTWLITRWSKRQRRAALDAAAAVQEAEQNAARLRLLETAVLRPVPPRLDR
jgi:hypothetical protein